MSGEPLPGRPGAGLGCPRHTACVLTCADWGPEQEVGSRECLAVSGLAQAVALDVAFLFNPHQGARLFPIDFRENGGERGETEALT